MYLQGNQVVSHEDTNMKNESLKCQPKPLPFLNILDILLGSILVVKANQEVTS